MSECIDSLSVKEAIDACGEYVSTTVGSSMRPMLRDRRDTVVIRRLDRRAKKYDVVLYRTEAGCVLHRVIRVLPDSYTVCGDNRTVLENVRDDDILGVLVAVYRGERPIRLDSLGYGLYCFYIVNSFYPRKLFRKIRSFLSKIKNKRPREDRGD